MITEDKKDIAITKLTTVLDKLSPTRPTRQLAIEIVNLLVDLFKDAPLHHVLKMDEITPCQTAWKKTLEHFHIERPILPHENVAIAELIRVYGYKSVLYALTGVRFEQKTTTFDPSRNIAIARLRDPKLFEKFVNLAAQKKKEQESK